MIVMSELAAFFDSQKLFTFYDHNHKIKLFDLTKENFMLCKEKLQSENEKIVLTVKSGQTNIIVDSITNYFNDLDFLKLTDGVNIYQITKY